MSFAKNGFLLIDKPLGITSRQALFNVQKAIDCRKMGHTGTLDPLATGLLVLLCGQARKLQDILTLDNKEYEVCVFLGATSETDDSEGPIHENEQAQPCHRDDVEKSVAKFVGEIEQIPPRYSAIKIKGKRAYKRARDGENVSMPSRKIKIHAIEILAYDYPHLKLRVKCGSGTYIRSLARDIGEDLNVGGYVTELHRTQVGQFDINQSSKIEDVSPETILPLEKIVVDYPRIDLEDKYLRRICHGQKIAVPNITEQQFSSPAFLWINDRVIAIAKIGDGFVASRKLLIDEAS
ncbi:tRNA pseudouridine(55) synthase TruB [Candidatus Uabimicrobium amorphum]|uniref:tRNA pseudouridine synthase B n=1 Tax=Uabimicrobium amorphum TaxID=2596890 RepID=A0A5S9F1N1_UABAM|nr:tRNA pseudouridine(55) synthase TruB [Candidatus Uabimicrobium amorphum]BBM82746.1 tRNA pseudouridine synthase B [Candidatus Uabimicrobium amorphum]